MIEKRDEIVAALRKKGLRRLSRQIFGTVADIVEQYAADKEISPQATKHPLVQKAVVAQSRLGWEAFFRGYLVREWQEALRATHNGDASQQFDQFQQLVWFRYRKPIGMHATKLPMDPILILCELKVRDLQQC